MKKLLLFLSFFAASASFAQTTSFSFTNLSGDFTAHNRGAQHWGTSDWGAFGATPTIPQGNTHPLNFYTRFNWVDIESTSTQGVYSWTVFDAFVNQAIDSGAMFSFGVMAFCSACNLPNFGYPTYVHNGMQAEVAANRDWQNPSGFWVPNYHSVTWTTRYIALLHAIANHIASTSRNGIPFSKAFLGFDLRHYSDFGEGNGFATTPNGPCPSTAQITDTDLMFYTDSAIAIFPNVQLTIPMSYVAPNNDYVNADGNTGTQAAYHVLTATNNYGRIGWRRDNIGDDGFNAYLTGTTATFNSIPLKPLIMNMWQLAPIGGEPDAGTTAVTRCGTVYCDCHNEDTLFHMSYFGNGNYLFNSSSGASWTQLVTNIQAMSAEQGYHLLLTGGNMTTTLPTSGSFNITMNWQNTGLAPVYENWNVTYELRTGTGTVVWTGTSSKVLKLYLPSTSPVATSDNFTLNGVTAGTYNLYMIIRDPNGYKSPLYLGITGRNSDGSYLIRSSITVANSTTPVANAGTNQTLTAPTSSTVLDGSGSTGTISSYAWTQVSGPNTASIATPSAISTSVTNLIVGTYIFQLSVNGGASTSQVTITVNSAPTVTANAGLDQVINLPTSSTTLNGSSSTGTISSYAWTQVSGPGGLTITNANTVTATVTGLVQGIYIFQLSVNGGASTDQMQVQVNAASTTFSVFTNQVPAGPAGTDAPVELGMKFRSSQAGNVVGVRFYKFSNMTGTHIGELYSYPGGTRLAQVTFTGETSSGWQSMYFTTPVAITANTTYVISYFNASGIYYADNTGFASSIINSPLTGLVNGTDGGNGVYNYGASPIYPNQTFQQSNYFVDVLFTTATVTANAGVDQTIKLPINSVTLDGSGSTGTITDYTWSQLSGPNTASLGTASSVTATASNLIQGTYVFKLSLNSGTSTDQVTITVNPKSGPRKAFNVGSTKLLAN